MTQAAVSVVVVGLGSQVCLCYSLVFVVCVLFFVFGCNLLGSDHGEAVLSAVYHPSCLSLGPFIHPSVPVAYKHGSSIPAVPPVKTSVLWRAAPIVVSDKASLSVV